MYFVLEEFVITNSIHIPLFFLFKWINMCILQNELFIFCSLSYLIIIWSIFFNQKTHFRKIIIWKTLDVLHFSSQKPIATNFILNMYLARINSLSLFHEFYNWLLRICYFLFDFHFTKENICAKHKHKSIIFKKFQS